MSAKCWIFPSMCEESNGTPPPPEPPINEDELLRIREFIGKEVEGILLPIYSSNIYIDNGDTLETAIGKLDVAISASNPNNLLSGMLDVSLTTIPNRDTLTFDSSINKWTNSNRLTNLENSFSVHTHAWAYITSKPITISGFGITDAYTKIETDSRISSAVSNVINSAPTVLDTLNELAVALGNDPNFSTSIMNIIGGKLNSSSYTPSDILAKLLTVDGTSSELDSDLLDGQHGSYYLNWSNVINKPTVVLSGDVSGSGLDTIVVSLSNSGVISGTYNTNSTSLTPFTVDSKGRITSTGTPFSASLSLLNDVVISNPVEFDILQFNINNSKWFNSNILVDILDRISNLESLIGGCCSPPPVDLTPIYNRLTNLEGLFSCIPPPISILNDLNDVDISHYSSVVNKDILSYDSSISQWINSNRLTVVENVLTIQTTQWVPLNQVLDFRDTTTSQLVTVSNPMVIPPLGIGYNTSLKPEYVGKLTNNIRFSVANMNGAMELLIQMNVPNNSQWVTIDSSNTVYTVSIVTKNWNLQQFQSMFPYSSPSSNINLIAEIEINVPGTNILSTNIPAKLVELEARIAYLGG